MISFHEPEQVRSEVQGFQDYKQRTAAGEEGRTGQCRGIQQRPYDKKQDTKAKLFGFGKK